LISRVDRTASGERRVEPTLGEDPVALVYYDRNGHFAAQFMKRDRSTGMVEAVAGAPNNSSAQGGYDAYFGEYAIVESTGPVAHRLVAAISQENVGHVMKRTLVVSGDTLTITLDTATAQGEPVTRTLTWKRVG